MKRFTGPRDDPAAFPRDHALDGTTGPADTAKMQRMSTEVRRSARRGVRDMIPLLIPAVPFALVLGIAIAESTVPNVAGWASSWLIFGGAAQLTAVTLLAEGSGVVAAIVGALTVNARHVMYSAALIPKFRAQTPWFRKLGPYFLLDQVFALVSLHDAPPRIWRAYYLGAGLFAWTIWQTFVGVGVIFGPAVSADLDISFTVPALFLGLLVPALSRRPQVAAAIVGAGVTAAFWQVPNRGGMLIGGVAGIVAGYLAEPKPKDEQ